jgi:predicted TPR repeat methyltransferase
MTAEIEDRTQYDWFSIGKMHENKGDYDKAVHAYEEALKLDPQLAKAWFYKAKLHHKLKQMEEAKECAKKVLELKPDWEKHIKKFMDT